MCDNCVHAQLLSMLLCLLPSASSIQRLAGLHVHMQALHVYTAVGVVVHLSGGETGSTASIAASSPSPAPKTLP